MKTEEIISNEQKQNDGKGYVSTHITAGRYKQDEVSHNIVSCIKFVQYDQEGNLATRLVNKIQFNIGMSCLAATETEFLYALCTSDNQELFTKFEKSPYQPVEIGEEIIFSGIGAIEGLIKGSTTIWNIDIQFESQELSTFYLFIWGRPNNDRGGAFYLETPHTATISYEGGPVNENNFQSWLNGFIIGLAVKPFPIKPKQTPAEPWELLVDMDITTAVFNDFDDSCANFESDIICGEDPPDTERLYRLTVDGVPITQIVGIASDVRYIGSGGKAYYVGNIGLWGIADNGEATPDGEPDFCLFVVPYASDAIVTAPNTVFVSRVPGTYHFKVERLKKDPVAYSYNGTRLPALPKDGYACILTSENGTARLLYSSENMGSYVEYSVEDEAFVARRKAFSLECYVYDQTQGHTNWVRWVDGDDSLAIGESYPLPGEALLWANSTIRWYENPDNVWAGYTTILSSSRAMPIFDYKEW